MGRALIFALAFCLLFLAFPLVGGAPASGYYEDYEITVEARADRSMRVQESLTYRNTLPRTVKLPITKTIPSPDVENVQVWDYQGPLEFEVSKTEEDTTISFETPWISPRQRYSYHLSYSVSGVVRGVGVEYRVYFWGINFSIRCDNFTLVLKGPSETYPFSCRPQAELASMDPPTWRYSASFDEGESFGGLRARFYEHPAYYLVSLSYTMTGLEKTDRIILDTTVLNPGVRWQFSSIALSSSPPTGSYLDADNNLHLFFDFQDPEGPLSVSVQLLYETDVHDPRLEATDVGSFGDIPNGLDTYTLSDNRWWLSDHPLISQRADQISAGEANVYVVAEEIVSFVTDWLEYEEQDERRGSLWAYTNRRGDCSEYTDLTIALARSAGIPSRAAYGWGYENENLRGHAWAELYFPGQEWQPVDPTWIATGGDYFAKLGPIHLTRSLRGVETTEGWMRLMFYGAEPEYDEDWVVEPISDQTAAQLYLSAAELHLSLASAMLEGIENTELEAELRAAEGEISAARASADPVEISNHCKSSILHSNRVIEALGKPPAFERGLGIFELLLIGLVAGLLAGAAGVLLKRLG